MEFIKLEVGNIIRSIFAWLCEFIYPLVANLYELYMHVCQATVLTTEEIKGIYDRITVILTIIMVFYITFQFVKYIVEPDDIFDKNKGVQNIFVKAILVIVLLAFTPRIFGLAYQIQGSIFEYDLFSTIILGEKYNTQVIGAADNTENMFAQRGKQFSASILNMFYRVNEKKATNIICDNGNDLPCQLIVAININDLALNGKLNYLDLGINSKSEETIKAETSGKINTAEVKTYDIDFDAHGLYPVIVGIIIAYILVIYCIDAGTRVIQMAYLQAISPIPIIGYLSPKKDGIFQAWVKQCVTTYIDLFIRTSIIYFILFVVRVLLDSFESGSASIISTSTGISPTMEKLVYTAIILGLLLFAKKVPKMIEELLPKGMGSAAAKGNFGLKFTDRVPGGEKGLKAIGRAAGLTVGAATGAVIGGASGLAQGFRKRNATWKNGKRKGVFGAVTGATWGALRGTVGGVTKGAANGAKKGNIIKNATMGAKNQIKSNTQYGNRAENGYTLGHQIRDVASNTFGGKSRVEKEEAKKAPVKRQQEAVSKIDKLNTDIRDLAKQKVTQGKTYTDANGKPIAAFGQKFKEAERKLKQYEESDPELMKQFKVGKYKTEAEAENAYKKDLKSAIDAVKIQDYSNEEEMEKAIEEAQKRISRDEYTVGNYETEEEARKALSEYGGKLAEDQKKALDEEIDALITSGLEKGISDKISILETELEEYNKSASDDRKIDMETIRTKLKDGHEFDDYIKKVIKDQETAISKEEISINEEIERIKRETSGSGIAGDTK